MGTNTPCSNQIFTCTYITNGVYDVCDTQEVCIKDISMYEGISKSFIYRGIIPVYKITFTSSKIPISYSLTCSYLSNGIPGTINICKAPIHKMLYHHISSRCKCELESKDPVMYSHIVLTNNMFNNIVHTLYRYDDTDIYVLYLSSLSSINITHITSLYIS